MLNVEVKWRQCRLLPLWGFFCRNFDLFEHFHFSFPVSGPNHSGFISNRRGEGKRLLTKKLVSGKYWLELYQYINININISIYWNYIGGSAWLGSQDPLFLRAGGVGTIHAISNLPHGHSSSHPTDLFGHFSKNWFSSFFTATKETVGAFFLGTQGLNLASFGFRSPFQSQWKFVSPNWGVQIVYQLHNPFSCSKFVSFNKLVCLNSFPSFTVFYVDHRPEHITWLRRSLIKFWICGAQYWLRW